MNKIIFIMLTLSLMQGCATFRIGDLKSTILIKDKNLIKDHDTFDNLPIVIRYHSNQGMDIESDYSATRVEIFETVERYFPNQKVDYFENYNTVPNEYINIHIIRDIPDEREDEPTTFKYITAVFSGATFMILPMNDTDIESHVKISYIKDEKRLHSTLYNQDSRRMIGFTMIPAAFFFNTDSALKASLSEAFEEYLKHEG